LVLAVTALGASGAVLATAPAAVAAGTWSAAAVVVPFAGVGNPLPAPSVGLDGSGNAVAVGKPPSSTSAVVAAFRPAGGAWSGPVQISVTGENVFDPSVAVAGDGTAVAAWGAFQGQTPLVEAAMRAPGQPFGPPLVLASGQTVISVQPGIDGSGRATVAFSSLDAASVRHLFAVTGTAAGVAPAVALSPAGQDVAEPALAVDAAGQAVATWSVASSDANANGAGIAIDAVTFAPAVGWSAPAVLETGSDVDNGAVAIDGHGTATAAWFSGSGSQTVPNRIRVAVGSAADVWGAPATVSAQTGASGAPRAAADPAGDAAVVWPSGSAQIEAVVRVGAAGRFGGPAVVSGSSTGAGTPEVAAAADGSLFAVSWADGGSAAVTTVAPGGQAAAPVALGRAQSGTPVAVAAAPGGRAAVVWNQPVPGRHHSVIAGSALE
jgi:hypothetical protein